MNKLKKNLHLLITIFLAFNTSSLIAQNAVKSDKILNQLTEEQKAMLKEQQLFIIKSKKEFKNSLSDKQKKILLDKNYSRSEKSKLLKESLSKKQQSLVNANKHKLRNRQVNFKRTLTKKQMIRLRRFVSVRDIHDRKRLIRRLRRLIRDNLNVDN